MGVLKTRLDAARARVKELEARVAFLERELERKNVNESEIAAKHLATEGGCPASRGVEDFIVN